jgi:hypothetical protein
LSDLRKQDKKKWTLGKLAEKYEMTRQSIVLIIQEEEKSRRLAAQL